MKIPEGYTEEQVLEILDRITKRLAYIFRFGCNDIEDIMQEGKSCGIEILAQGKYDGKRPLDSFLYTCIHHHLYNNKRNKYSRIQAPCLQCPFHDPEKLKSTNECAAFEDKMECDKWAKWFVRNDAKRNLNHPVDIEDIGDDYTRYSQDIAGDVDLKDKFDRINSEMPVSFRADFLRMRDGESIPKGRRDAIIKVIKEIFSVG